MGGNGVLMVRNQNAETVYAPLHCARFRVVQPHTLVEAEKFNLQYTNPNQIDHTADKLRWYRYRKGLRQRDVAAMIGVDRSTYVHMEDRIHDYYPQEVLERLSAVFEVSIEALLDNYNRFLWSGQGAQIRRIRIQRNLTQQQFARELDVPLGTLKNWERERVRISKRTWEKLFHSI